jgi:hypothetical protein
MFSITGSAVIELALDFPLVGPLPASCLPVSSLFLTLVRDICHAADTGWKIFYKVQFKLGRCFTRGLQAFENTGVLPLAGFGYTLLMLFVNIKLYFQG